MNITGTLITYFIFCQRRCWLHANSIRMEHTSDLVAEGKLIGETSYPGRAAKYTEISLFATLPGGIEATAKIDYYDAANRVVHEVKKSSSHEEAHEWQVKFYLWLLQLNGVPEATGILEYPKIRETMDVSLSEPDMEYLQQIVNAVAAMMQSDACPERLPVKRCKHCAYFDFCWSGEQELEG